MLIGYFVVKDHFIGVVCQSFSCVLDFTAVETLAENEFPDFCYELASSF